MRVTPIIRLARTCAQRAAAPAAATHVPAPRLKETTEITGLAVHADPLTELAQVYQRTLSTLSALPAESVYAQAARAITQARVEALEKVKTVQHAEEKIRAFESDVDAGQAEEVLLQALDEEKLAKSMGEWKA